MVNRPLDKSLFNIDILSITEDHTKYMGEVKTGLVFKSSSDEFHPEGLYSTIIFGPIGSELRNSKTGYIDMKLKVMHPLLFNVIQNLKASYTNIIFGKQRAVFDKKLKDFVLVGDGEGETGFSFFLEHMEELNPTSDSDSERREYNLKFFHKFKGKEYLYDKCLVLPAGLRDYVRDKNGRPSEDEVNNLYRKLLISTSLLNNMNLNGMNPKMLDPIRVKLQRTFNAVFEHFYTMLNGKEKFIQAKWAKRTIEYGTRNVLTSFPEKVTDLGSETSSSNLNMTAVGIYQFVKSITPITVFHIQSTFSNRFFNPNSDTALLVDPETGQSGYVKIPVKKRDEWFSVEGIEGLMEKINSPETREAPVKVDKYYLAMCYDKGNDFRLFKHTNDIPEELDKKYIRPLTYVEMFYIAIYEVRSKYPAFVTRFPVTGLGSIYPTYVNVKTTVIHRTVNANIFGEELSMVEFPIAGEEYLVSTSVHQTKLGRLGADFDGSLILPSLNSLNSVELLIGQY